MSVDMPPPPLAPTLGRQRSRSQSPPPPPQPKQQLSMERQRSRSASPQPSSAANASGSAPAPAAQAESGAIRVYARLRPLNALEQAKGGEDSRCLTCDPDGTSLTIESGPSTHHRFSFASVFGEKSSQEEVFKLVAAPLVASTLNGFNSAILAYGQTGSGKTYTMQGPTNEGPTAGIIPRVFQLLFEQIDQYDPDAVTVDVRASFVEIYNEEVVDILSDARQRVSVFEDSSRNLFVTQATEVPVGSFRTAMDVWKRGVRLRTVAETVMNIESSRSHALYILTVANHNNHSGVTKFSQLYLVDLAGSEKAWKTGASGERLGEAGYINKSLLALGQVIARLSEQEQNKKKKTTTTTTTKKKKKKKTTTTTTKNRGGRTTTKTTGPRGGRPQTATPMTTRKKNGKGKRRSRRSSACHVPYRDSKLTRLLQNSIGGNSVTAVVIALSPAAWNAQETLSTLRFGDRTSQIRNAPKANAVLGIQELEELLRTVQRRVVSNRTEIQRLRERKEQLLRFFQAAGVSRQELDLDRDQAAAAAAAATTDERKSPAPSSSLPTPPSPEHRDDDATGCSGLGSPRRLETSAPEPRRADARHKDNDEEEDDDDDDEEEEEDDDIWQQRPRTADEQRRGLLGHRPHGQVRESWVALERRKASLRQMAVDMTLRGVGMGNS